MKLFEVEETINGIKTTREMTKIEKIVTLTVLLGIIIFLILTVVRFYNNMEEYSERQEQAKPYIENQLTNKFDTYYHSNSLGEKTDNTDYNTNSFYVVSNNKLYFCSYSVSKDRLVITEEGDLPTVIYEVVEE